MQINAAVSRDNQASPQIETVELDDPQPGEVLVRIVAAGICHTDFLFHGAFGANFSTKPMVLGHEGAGVIEKVGVGVRGLAVGDHVVLSGNSCGHCPSCESGRTVYCEDMVKLCWSGRRPDGTSPLGQDGQPISGAFFGQSSFATHAIASERTAVKVPNDVPLHLLGPLACGMVTGAGSVLEALRLQPGQSIAVFGVGAVGMAAIMAAAIAGASQIVAVDVHEQRLELARSLGATDIVRSDAQTIDALRRLRPKGFDFTLITAPPAAVFDAATACLAVEGTAGYVIPPNGDWVPNLFQLMTGGRKLQGIIGGNANPKTFIPRMIEFWRQGRFPFDRLITEFPFADIRTAWDKYREGSVVKPVLRM